MVGHTTYVLVLKENNNDTMNIESRVHDAENAKESNEEEHDSNDVKTA